MWSTGCPGWPSTTATSSSPDGSGSEASSRTRTPASLSPRELSPSRSCARPTSPPRMAFDHGDIVLAGRERLRGKLSYTNAGFALAPRTFTISELGQAYIAALGHEVSATNLKRV